MKRDSRYLESVLHHDIPLTRDMGLKVVSWHEHQLRLQMPLAANINHKSTMFGGSLYCGAVLAGWGWLHLSLREAGIEDGHIVIQEGHISYPLPVTQDAIVLCDAPGEAAWHKFLCHVQTPWPRTLEPRYPSDQCRRRGGCGAVQWAVRLASLTGQAPRKPGCLPREASNPASETHACRYNVMRARANSCSRQGACAGNAKNESLSNDSRAG